MATGRDPVFFGDVLHRLARSPRRPLVLRPWPKDKADRGRRRTITTQRIHRALGKSNE